MQAAVGLLIICIIAWYILAKKNPGKFAPFLAPPYGKKRGLLCLAALFVIGAVGATIDPPPAPNKATTNNASTPKAAPVVRGGTTGPNGETIKGNINKKGEKIYHMPGSASYNRTIPEAWFSTPEEAEAAGYRQARK